MVLKLVMLSFFSARVYVFLESSLIVKKNVARFVFIDNVKFVV
jgi:hypothetical protein